MAKIRVVIEGDVPFRELKKTAESEGYNGWENFMKSLFEIHADLISEDLSDRIGKASVWTVKKVERFG